MSTEDQGSRDPVAPGSVIDPEILAANVRSAAVEREPLDVSLRRVLDACRQMFAVDGCGLMTADDQGALRYVVATDGPATVLEDAQLATGEGPCVDAYVRAEPVGSADLTADERYPALALRLRGSGVRAVLGVPVQLAGSRVGSLNVLRAEPGEWSPSEQSSLSAWGSVIETILRASLDAHQTGELAAQLQYALDYRVPIERAVGYLMARDGLESTAAFDLLRGAARSSRRKIVDVAEQLMADGQLPGEDGLPPA